MSGASAARAAVARLGEPIAPLAALRIGAYARARLREESGRVLAVFRRSLYVEAESGSLFCVGAASLGDGPLHLLCALPPGLDWAAQGLEPGAPAWIGPQRIDLAGRWVLRVAGAETWRPAPLPPCDGGRLAEGLRLLDGAVRERPPRGLARLVVDLSRAGAAMDPVDAVQARVLALAAEAARAIHAALAPHGHPLQGVVESFSTLLGLGSGLTPAGDDFVGGALIALHGLGRGVLARALAAPLLAQARGRTGRISAAHLAAAADGVGAAALHDALRALASADGAALLPALHALDAIGHSSGWDALAGALSVCRALTGDPPAPGAATGNGS
jgi:Protein of unknown function (DUF2877)